MLKIFFYLLLSFFLLACHPNLEYEIHGYTEKIIVEGFIANGEFPKVYLTLNVPLWQEVDSSLILGKVIRTAKVTVSDGVESEILTSHWNKSHFPPYEYRGTELKGESGKTYFLKVEYSGFSLMSQTTIPFPAIVKKIEISPFQNSDSLRDIVLVVEMDSTYNLGYRLFSFKNKDDSFIETPTIYNDNFNLIGDQNFAVSPRPNIQDSSYSEGSHFLKGDTVTIRTCVIDSSATLFFKSFSVNSLPGKDFFLAENKSFKSNISTPGFGIWYGCGIKNYKIVIK